MNHKRTGAAATGLAMLCTGLFAATPAMASHGGGDAIRTSGQCANGPGVWKLKGKADDGRIEIEFEVDTNRVGQVWHVRITDNGDVVANQDFTTMAPSGSFTVHRRPANQVGTDTIRAHAIRGDRVCGGQVQV
jgi:hypothetical protein